MDFSEGLATVAECKLKGDSFDLNQIDVTVLPEDATDKGCPSDPAAMAELLKSVIAERNVVAKRCAVVMPAIAFTAVPLCIDAEISAGVSGCSVGLLLKVPGCSSSYRR